MFYNMVFIKVLVYLSSATCTMNLQNPKNGSRLPSRDSRCAKSPDFEQ